MPTVPELPTIATLDDADAVILDDVSAPETGRVTIAALRDHIVRPQVATEAGTTRTLALADEGAVIRCTAVGGCTLTIPTGLPVGWTCTIVRAPGAGSVQVDGDVGVSVQKPASAATPAVVAEEGGTVGVTIVDTNVAHLMGSLG